MFPSGRVEADGVTPTTTEIKCKINAAGLKSAPRNLDGYWYPPSAQEMEEDRAAAAAAQAAGRVAPPPWGFGAGTRRYPNPNSAVGSNSATAHRKERRDHKKLLEKRKAEEVTKSGSGSGNAEEFIKSGTEDRDHALGDA